MLILRGRIELSERIQGGKNVKERRKEGANGSETVGLRDGGKKKEGREPWGGLRGWRGMALEERAVLCEC